MKTKINAIRIVGKQDDVIWAIGALCRKYGKDTTVLEAVRRYKQEHEGRSLKVKELVK